MTLHIPWGPKISLYCSIMHRFREKCGGFFFFWGGGGVWCVFYAEIQDGHQKMADKRFLAKSGI